MSDGEMMFADPCLGRVPPVRMGRWQHRLEEEEVKEGPDQDVANREKERANTSACGAYSQGEARSLLAGGLKLGRPPGVTRPFPGGGTFLWPGSAGWKTQGEA